MPEAKVTAFYQRAASALAGLEDYVAEGAFLTLVLHTPGEPEQEAVITRAPDLQPVIDALQRSMLRADTSPQSDRGER